MSWIVWWQAGPISVRASNVYVLSLLHSLTIMSHRPMDFVTSASNRIAYLATFGSATGSIFIMFLAFHKLDGFWITSEYFNIIMGYSVADPGFWARTIC